MECAFPGYINFPCEPACDAYLPFRLTLDVYVSDIGLMINDVSATNFI